MSTITFPSSRSLLIEAIEVWYEVFEKACGLCLLGLRKSESASTYLCGKLHDLSVRHSPRIEIYKIQEANNLVCKCGIQGMRQKSNYFEKFLELVN